MKMKRWVPENPSDEPEGPVEEPELAFSVSKIETVAADANEAESQENQDLILNIRQGGDTVEIFIDGGVDALNEFASTNPAQGTGKWIGLAIDTGEDDITKVSVGNYQLTQDDVDEAASVGVPAGSFVLWLKAENYIGEDNARELILKTDGKKDTTIKIFVAAA